MPEFHHRNGNDEDTDVHKLAYCPAFVKPHPCREDRTEPVAADRRGYDAWH